MLEAAVFSPETLSALRGAMSRGAVPSGDGGRVLKVSGDRPIRIELTARHIGVISKNDVLLCRTRRTIECAEELADLLSGQRLILEAEALRKEAARWRW